MDDDKSVITRRIRATHGGHRERIFTEPVMEALIEQLGKHYYRIRDHLEKPQAVVTEIAENINKKIPGLQLTPNQVYGRMINLQNSLRRYWESVAVGDFKKKPRYYELLCQVFGTDYTSTVQTEEYINGTEDLDSNSPNHITVELPEFFDANTLNSGQYTTTCSSTHRPVASGSGREDVWTTHLTNVLLQAMEKCIGMLRSRPDKFKAWKIILNAVNDNVEGEPLTVYQVKVKVKRMLAAVRKYERQAARGQLFVDKPFFYDAIKALFSRELRPIQSSGQSTVMDGVESFTSRRSSSLSLSMTSFMRRSAQLLEESVQIQRDMRDEMRDFHAKVLEQLRTFNESYRMLTLSAVTGKRKRMDDDELDDFEEVEELIGDEQSDLEEGIVEQEEFDEMQVASTIM